METNTQSTFTKIDPSRLDPMLQQAYKDMQADYTRKTQELADQRKALESQGGQTLQRITELENAIKQGQTYVSQLEQSNQALTNANQQWETYVKQTLIPTGAQATPTGRTVSQDPDADTDATQPSSGGARTVVGPDGRVFQVADPVQSLSARIKELEAQMQQGAAKIGSQLNIVTQMGELTRRYGSKPYFDPRAVLKVALDRRIDDMEEAFERTYAKELRDEMVSAEVEKKVKEALAAQQTDPMENRVAGGNGAVPYIPNDEHSGSYDDANRAFLDSLARGEET